MSLSKEVTSEWFDELPKCWSAIRIKHGFRLIGSGTTPPTGEARYYDGTVLWVNTSELRENVIFSTEKTLTTEAIEEFTTLRIYHAGTVLFAMYGATIGRVGILGIPATVNQAVCALAEPNRFAPRFAFYGLQASRDILAASSSGGGQPNLNAEKVREHKLPCPDLKSQGAIADYLDHETARLDALVAAKERVLGLLAEKRRALITRAVTRGLDPRAPLRDSGIPWLGEIPAYWEMVPFRWYFRIHSGDFLPSDDVATEADAVRRIKVIGGNGLAGYTDRSNVEGTTVVIGRVGALCGNVHLVEGPAWITDNALLLTSVRSFVPAYLAHVLRELNLNSLANKTAQPLITGSMVADLRGPLPPSDEQRGIVEYITHEVAKIAAVYAATERTIALLKERRAALIAAAVTGRIDVQGAIA